MSDNPTNGTNGAIRTHEAIKAHRDWMEAMKKKYHFLHGFFPNVPLPVVDATPERIKRMRVEMIRGVKCVQGIIAHTKQPIMVIDLRPEMVAAIEAMQRAGKATDYATAQTEQGKVIALLREACTGVTVGMGRHRRDLAYFILGSADTVIDDAPYKITRGMVAFDEVFGADDPPIVTGPKSEGDSWTGGIFTTEYKIDVPKTGGKDGETEKKDVLLLVQISRNGMPQKCQFHLANEGNAKTGVEGNTKMALLLVDSTATGKPEVTPKLFAPAKRAVTPRKPAPK